MSKKIAEETEQKESVLSKITNFFKANKGASTVAETVADDDEEAKKVDDEEEMSAETEAEKEDDKEATTADKEDDDDDDDPDKDDDDDSDEDEIEINGKKVNLKDPKATREAIEELMQVNAAQYELLTEAADELAEKKETIQAQEVQIKKTTEQVKKEIKSTFVPQSSKRSHKIGEKEQEVIPDVLTPKEGSMADRVLRQALAKAKSAKKI